jgi:acetyl-CoA C-acetyltransferase
LAERRAAIVGIHEYPRRVVPDCSVLQIKASSAMAALVDAGLSWNEVDGIYDVGEAGWINSPSALSEYFGVHPKSVDSTAVGGSSYEVLTEHAVRDIRAGRVNVAVITYGSRQRSGGRSATLPRAKTPNNNMEDVWGNTLIGQYAMATRRHMHEYGTTSEQIAEIAVICRKHALRNPEAVRALTDLGIRPVEITAADVLASRLIADPLHLLDCCLVSDGGGAIVIASSDVVPGTRQKPAWIIGTGTGVGYVENGGDIATSAGAQSGPAAFGEAGVRSDEVDVAMFYDSFTYTVLTALEDIGFCKKGEGADFIAGGRLAFDSGRRPAVNTDGGGLSSNHPNMRGLFLLMESTRQLRGTSTSQVPGAKLAVAHGNGGYLSGRHCASTVVLSA